jgi:putative transposase
VERLPGSVRTRKRLQDLFNGNGEGGGKSDLVRLAARLILEEAIEGEVRDHVGRGYYEHGSAEGSGRRNGYRTGRLKTAEGEIEYSKPQVADSIEPFTSRIHRELSGRTDELERLAVEMYARGLSTRDIEKTFQSRDGKPMLSKTVVSEITERLWIEYQEFASRDLSEYEVLYLFVDGIAERLHLGQPREAVLVAWGFTAEGERVLLHVSPGTKEDTDCCREFFRDMKNRGMKDPLLVITDGAQGLIRATEECFPKSLRQRCLAHRLRNLENKGILAEKWPEVKAAALAAYRAASPKLAEMLRDEFKATYESEYPSLVKCFLDDFPACIAHLQLPIGHRRATRTTNLLERLFGEERRRTKTIPHAFGEKPVLKLMYASLIRASQTWKNIKITEFELRQINQLRQEVAAKHYARNQQVVVKGSVSPTKLSSIKKT